MRIDRVKELSRGTLDRDTDKPLPWVTMTCQVDAGEWAVTEDNIEQVRQRLVAAAKRTLEPYGRIVPTNIDMNWATDTGIQINMRLVAIDGGLPKKQAGAVARSAGRGARAILLDEDGT